LEDIKEFVKLFREKSKKYVAIFKAPSIFLKITDSCEALNVTVTQDAGDYAGTVDNFGFKLKVKTNETYVIINNIEALDFQVAREKAEKKIQLVSTLLTLFHHKDHPTWSSESVIVSDADERTKIRLPSNPMTKCIDMKPEKAAKRLNDLISNFSLKPESFKRFDRCALLHSMALKDNSSENQLVNLWIALESLVPSTSTGTKKAKIENISDRVLPFLSLNYINRLLGKLLADLFTWDRKKLNETLRGIPGEVIPPKTNRSHK